MSKIKKECTFFWFVENYSYWWHKLGVCLVSPTFIIDGLERTAWQIQIYPRGVNSYHKEIYVKVRRNDTDGPEKFETNIHLSLVAKDGSSLFFLEKKAIFYKTYPYILTYKRDDFLSLRKGERLPKNILTVRCTLRTDGGNTESEKISPICARTRIGIEHISFLHAIEGFSTFEPNRKILVRIPCRSRKRGAIASSIYFTDGSCCENKIMIQNTAADTNQILSKCRIFLLDKSGNLVKCAEGDNRFDAERKDIEKLPLSLTKDAIISKKSDYLPKDKLTLLCECSFSTGIEFERIEEPASELTTMAVTHSSNHQSIEKKLSECVNALDELKGAYYDKLLTDVELKTKTNSFPAHKIVLCARSPVFKVMMNSDMKEKISGSIQVDELEDDTVQQMLHFLYSDNLEDLQWETAIKLYYAADKYQIEKLKLICSAFLIENLTIFTATELLILADTHSDSDLKKIVEDFILDNDELVFALDKWEELAETNPQLALKTMQLKYKMKTGK